MSRASSWHRPARSGLELFGALLAVWAAAHQTPLGLLLRKAVAVAWGARTGPWELTACYQGSESGAVAPLAAPADLPGDAALALALWEVRDGLDSGEQARVLEALGAAWPPSEPTGLVEALGRCRARWRSEEACALALFTGPEPVTFAQGRALTPRAPLEALAAELPPGYEGAAARGRELAQLATAYRLGWPVAARAKVSSGFGMRLHPVLGVRKLHTGVDLVVPPGTTVRAAAAGKVATAGADAVCGWKVVLDHGHGVSTGYCHNTALRVTQGQRVRRGQPIAVSGNTGRSTAPHLHYQVELGVRPVDPLRLQQTARRAGGRWAVR